MSPIALNLFGHSIHWYGIMAGIGFLAAIRVMSRKRPYAQVSEDDLINTAVWTMIAGILGARIYYVISHYRYFAERPFWKVLAIWEGGLIYYGGFILAALFLLWYSRRKKFSIARMADLFAVGLPLGHIFGRIGCFLQGCCYGAPTRCPLGVHYPAETFLQDGKPALAYADILSRYPAEAIHPVQLYEAFGILLVFIFLYRTLGRFKPGQTTALYLILYGVVRFATESFRGEYDANQMTHIFGIELMPGHVDSLFLIIPAGIIVWFICGRLKKGVEQHA